MRILHLIPILSSGGTERQLRYLVEAMAPRHELHVGYVHSGPDDDDESQWPAIVHKIAITGNQDPRLLLHLLLLMQKIRPQIVQTWLLQMDVAGGLACMLTGRKWVLREPSIEAAYGNSWKFRARELLAARCNAIVANSAGGASYWAARHPRKPAQIIRNAVPLEAIQRAPARLPENFGCPAGMPTVVYAGRLVSDRYSEKNLVRLLTAIHLANQHTPCCAVIAGVGPQRTELMSLAARLGIGARVSFPGRLSARDLWGLMKSASLFALVSPFEGMPNSALEAVACGCPVLLSDIPVHRELLAEDMAVFVDHEDAKAICRGIVDSLTNERGSRDRASRALERVADWSVARMADSYESLYRRVLSGRGPQ